MESAVSSRWVHNSVSIEPTAYEISNNYWAEDSKGYFGFVGMNIGIWEGSEYAIKEESLRR